MWIDFTSTILAKRRHSNLRVLAAIRSCLDSELISCYIILINQDQITFVFQNSAVARIKGFFAFCWNRSNRSCIEIDENGRSYKKSRSYKEQNYLYRE